MNDRRLGCSGLKLSALSFGSWVTYGNRVDAHGARITEATRVAQIEENMKAIEVAPKLDVEAMRRIDAIVGTAYD